jgi:hypothetical protein
MWFVSPWMQVGCGFAFIRYSIKTHFKNYPLSHPWTNSTGLVSKPPFSSANLELLPSSGAALMILGFIANNQFRRFHRNHDWIAGCAVRNRVTGFTASYIIVRDVLTTRLRPGHRSTIEDNGKGFAVFAATEMED